MVKQNVMPAHKATKLERDNLHRARAVLNGPLTASEKMPTVMSLLPRSMRRSFALNIAGKATAWFEDNLDGKNTDLSRKMFMLIEATTVWVELRDELLLFALNNEGSPVGDCVAAVTCATSHDDQFAAVRSAQAVYRLEGAQPETTERVFEMIDKMIGERLGKGGA